MKLKTLGRKLAPSTRAKVKVEKIADPFYSSPAWRALMAFLIKRRGRRCEDREHNSATPQTGRIFGDHIVERKDGGAPFDPGNILLRCARCHGFKTSAERARRYGLRSRGGDRNLLPAKGAPPQGSHAREFFGRGEV